MVDHLLQECDMIGKFLLTDKDPVLSGDSSKVDRYINYIISISMMHTAIACK